MLVVVAYFEDKVPDSLHHKSQNILPVLKLNHVRNMGVLGALLEVVTLSRLCIVNKPLQYALLYHNLAAKDLSYSSNIARMFRDRMIRAKAKNKIKKNTR